MQNSLLGDSDGIDDGWTEESGLWPHNELGKIYRRVYTTYQYSLLGDVDGIDEGMFDGMDEGWTG